MKTFLIAACIGGALSLGGCSYKNISHGTEITEEEAAQIEIGRTRKDEIYIAFGEPTKVADDGQVLFYSWTRGSKTSFSGLGSGEAESKSLVVVFDDTNVVKNYRITRGATDMNQVD